LDFLIDDQDFVMGITGGLENYTVSLTPRVSHRDTFNGRGGYEQLANGVTVALKVSSPYWGNDYLHTSVFRMQSKFDPK
jgi:hypothetical protein